MIDVTVGGVRLNAGRLKVLDLAGWLDTPGVEVPSVERLRHGSFSGQGRAMGRTIKVTGRVQGTDYAQQMDDRHMLAGLFRDGDVVPVSVTVGESVLSTEARLIDRVEFTPESVAYSRWELSLYAPDPHLYGPELVTYLWPIGTGVGLEYPLYGPTTDPDGEPVLSYGAGIETQDPVSNAGNAPAWPVYVVVGDFPSGFQIRVGDRAVVWPHPTAPESPVEVDMAGAIRVGGMDQTHMAARRDWSSVPPGDTVFPRFEPIQAGTGWCEVHLRPTYI